MPLMINICLHCIIILPHCQFFMLNFTIEIHFFNILIKIKNFFVDFTHKTCPEGAATKSKSKYG